MAAALTSSFDRPPPAAGRERTGAALEPSQGAAAPCIPACHLKVNKVLQISLLTIPFGSLLHSCIQICMWLEAKLSFCSSTIINAAIGEESARGCG